MPLACDCWQVHGTFSMAPRVPLKRVAAVESSAWAAPVSTTPAARDDWPMFRANAAGTATVPAAIGQKARELWRRRLPASLTAPVCAGRRVFVGGSDGTVWALDAADGKVLWQASSHAAVLHPPAYWNGRVVFGSCDGVLYSVDGSNGRLLGSVELAPEKRFVNIMDRFMSAWPLGGGVVLGDGGIVYAVAGSTAADGAVAVAVDLAAGRVRWREAYTPDRKEPKLSFGVQSNLLLTNGMLCFNGGAPAGIVVMDQQTGLRAGIYCGHASGKELFLPPDSHWTWPRSSPACSGPALFAREGVGSTVIQPRQARVCFQISNWRVALVAGRLFGSRDQRAIDRIVDLMNKEPTTGQEMWWGMLARKVMSVPVDVATTWAGKTADVVGVAAGADGLVVLHPDRLEGLAADGRSLWALCLPAPPVRWGVALTGKECVVTLTDGLVLCLAGPGN